MVPTTSIVPCSDLYFMTFTTNLMFCETRIAHKTRFLYLTGRGYLICEDTAVSLGTVSTISMRTISRGLPSLVKLYLSIRHRFPLCFEFCQRTLSVSSLCMISRRKQLKCDTAQAFGFLFALSLSCANATIHQKSPNCLRSLSVVWTSNALKIPFIRSLASVLLNAITVDLFWKLSKLRTKRIWKQRFKRHSEQNRTAVIVYYTFLIIYSRRKK